MTTSSITPVAIFSVCESEKRQLDELRQFFKERGVDGLDSAAPGPTNIFESFKELLGASKSLLNKLTNDKEVELLLNSLFSLFISFSGEQLAALVQLFCQLLTDKHFSGCGWNSTAGVSVRLLSNLFRLHADKPELQFLELKSLLEMAGRARLTQFLDIGTAEIDEFARSWKLDVPRHRELCRMLHGALCQDGRHEQAAEMMATFLRTYTDADAESAREDARECVRTVVVDPRAFYFDHLLDLSAVKSLEQTDPLMYAALAICVNHSLPEYRQFTAQNPTFVREQLRVEEKVFEKKIKMLTLISLAERKQPQQHLQLAELSKQLDIGDEEELEAFLIDAIRAQAINGKIDDVNGRLTVTFHQQRVFGPAQWEQLECRMGVLMDNIQTFHDNLAVMVAEGGEPVKKK